MHTVTEAQWDAIDEIAVEDEKAYLAETRPDGAIVMTFDDDSEYAYLIFADGEWKEADAAWTPDMQLLIRPPRWN